MDKKEKRMFLEFMGLCNDLLGNRSCNDVPESLWEEWTIQERQKFVKEFHDWNGDPEEYNEEHLRLPDFAIVGFLMHKLRKELDGGD